MQIDTLIEKLNEDLAGELGAIIQYITYAARLSGPDRPQLAKFFLNELSDELAHAQFLANKITALGGTPTTAPRPIAEAHSNNDMLRAVLAAERQAVTDYTARAQQAAEYGDKGLAVQLEEMISDETTHAEETEKLLKA